MASLVDVTAAATQKPEAGHPRLIAAFLAEESSGLKLAFKLRLFALALVAVFLAFINGWPQVLYFHALMLGFVAIGAASLLATRPGTPPRAVEWMLWLVPVADLALMTFAIVYPNPLGGDDWLTLPMRLRFDNLLYPVLVISLATLAYSPRHVLWAGALSAFFWTVATFWVATLPGVTWVPLDTPPAAAVMSDPHVISVRVLAKQVFLLLVVSAILAGAVRRSRAVALRQVRAERDRIQLSRYFSAHVVEELVDLDQPFGAVGTQNVAVLFVDIVGFTRFSENETPDCVIGMLREFHKRMEAAVFAHRGTLDKYLGDGLMAVFGVPRPDVRDAANALAAARAMTVSLAEWNAVRLAAGDSRVDFGIGLHWGPVVLGNIGGQNRLEFATIGDTVNVASRLEHVTRDLDAEIVASREFVARVRATVGEAEAAGLLDGFVPAEPQSLRGRLAPIEVMLHRRTG